MAQLVERTLGKGEVPSSILGISTILSRPPQGGFFVFGHCKYFVADFKAVPLVITKRLQRL